MADVRVFKVDFNETGGASGRMLEVLAPDDGGAPEVDDRVVLLDGELNSCWARVDAADAGILTVELDLDTWAEPAPLDGSAYASAPDRKASFVVQVVSYLSEFRQTTEPFAETGQLDKLIGA